MVRTLACLSLRSFCTLLQSIDAQDLRDLRSCASMTEVFDELWNDRAGFDLVLLDGVADEAADLRFLADRYPAVSFCLVDPSRSGLQTSVGNLACFGSFDEVMHRVGPSRAAGLQQAG